jgi:hypothetical protein
LSKYAIDDTSLTAVANAIREKGGTSSPLTFPQGFVDAIGEISGGGGGSLKPFVLRPDAELVQQWTYDKLIVEDEGVTLPAYSTSQQTLKASITLLSSEGLDLDVHHFVVFQRMLTIPIYSEATIIKGREEFHENVYCYEIVNTPSGSIQSRDGEVTTADVASIPSSYNGSRLVYYNSNLSLTARDGSTYGATMTGGAVTLSGSRLTVKSPSIRIAGNTTYFPSAVWDMLTDIRYQYVVELWRSNVDASEPGWPISNGMHHIADCYKNGGTLT